MLNPPPPLKDQVFSPLKGVSASHPWQKIHQWLCDVLGAEPDRLVVTDPVQQLQCTIDLRPLMRILGGEWEACLNRAIAVKDQNSQGASKRGIATEGEDGAFMASALKRAGVVKKAPPTVEAKEFTRSADIAMDVTAKAADEETRVMAEPATREIPLSRAELMPQHLPPAQTKEVLYYVMAAGKPGRCSCGGGLFRLQPPSPEGFIRVQCITCDEIAALPTNVSIMAVPEALDNGAGI